MSRGEIADAVYHIYPTYTNPPFQRNCSRLRGRKRFAVEIPCFGCPSRPATDPTSPQPRAKPVSRAFHAAYSLVIPRIALARREQLDYASFLGIILSNEVNRRTHQRIELRLHSAGFDETCRLKDFDWSVSIALERRLLDAIFSLEILDRHEHVLLVGPAPPRLSGLAKLLLRRPPSLQELVTLVGYADDYTWFAGLLRRLFPDEAEAALAAPDVRKRVERFAHLFGERHYPPLRTILRLLPGRRGRTSLDLATEGYPLRTDGLRLRWSARGVGRLPRGASGHGPPRRGPR